MLLLPNAYAQADKEVALRPTDYFQGKQLTLARAINTDRADAVAAALADGANVQAAGKQGLTPLLYALANQKKTAVDLLLQRDADPNRRADNGENAVTVAARVFARQDLDYLRLMLEHGGDPNTRWTNDDPILETLINQYNLAGIRLLAKHKANLNIKNDGMDVTTSAAMVQYWDCVYTLLEEGARWDTEKHPGFTLADLAATAVIGKDSPIYPYLEKTIAFLKRKGVHVPPTTLAGIHRQKHQAH